MTKKRKRRPKFSDQLRAAIQGAGVSRYKIAMDTGISQPTLSRFMSGERGLTLKAVDTLADHLGWSVKVLQEHKQKSNRSKGR